MFTRFDIESIDRSYFNILFAGCFCAVLQSKNTRHYWVLQSGSEYPSCTILHKHRNDDIYHLHGRARNLADATGQIRSHDRFQLHGRKK